MGTLYLVRVFHLWSYYTDLHYIWYWRDHIRGCRTNL